MTRQDIVRQVVKIILNHAKPLRIYVYGSEASGEALSTSDIDIAYDDADFKDSYLIENEVEALTTLVKVDVKNIAFAEERFRNRVIGTGKVVYSSNKKLRAEDGLHNFSKALERFVDAVDRKDEFAREGYGDIYLDLVVKRFEFTYEMSWKAMKRYLSFVGIEAVNPRACFKESYAQGLIDDEAVWLDMLEKRNLSSHIYDENEIREILGALQKYKAAFEDTKNKLSEMLRSE